MGEFLSDFKKEFKEKEEETVKVVEPKKVKQRSKTIKKFI